MRLELIRVGLLVELANHYTTKGAFIQAKVDSLASQADVGRRTASSFLVLSHTS